jgi:alpha-amylase/alpha-mannosidase (GH57 family)
LFFQTGGIKGERSLENYICIHAHFYQPPRENPWLEAIERQKSAHPYHDWNQRITAECYQPNSMARILDSSGRIDRILNNYSRISFNFGPTLLSWLAGQDPATYAGILEADKESRARFSGHGSAIAQAYNHTILPLCNHRDKVTQIQWGIRDFSRRFGRMPESMWIPETAADLETLDLMAQMGLRYAILAPHQARRVREKTDRAWSDIQNQDIDPSRAYEILLPSGRRMAIFFYDGPISRAVGFEKLLRDGEAFASRLTSAFSAARKWPQMVHIATDGETYGHHHPFGEMALAYALHSIESKGKTRLTNYGEFLEKHTPTHLVEILENKSWSCPHGVGRWSENCGCGTGAHPGWQQEWRAPLRKALDWLRDRLENIYEAGAAALLKDPWAARNDYIDVILDRAPESVGRFLAAHRIRELNTEERVRVLKLQELQRHAMLMYTSCGWFFDDISRIETIQILQYAGRAIELGEELSGMNTIEAGFLQIVQNARSNDPDFGNGRDIYQKYVKTAMIAGHKVAGHYGVRSLFEDSPERSGFYSYNVDRQFSKTITSGKAKLAIGCCKINSQITGESSEAEYAVVHLGDGDIRGRTKACQGDGTGQMPVDEMTGAFEKSGFRAASPLLDAYFGPEEFSLDSLFLDEQLTALETMLKAANAGLEQSSRKAYECTAPLVRSLIKLGMEPPASFLGVAAIVTRSQLLHALQAEEFDLDDVLTFLEEAKSWQVELNKKELEAALREKIERLSTKSRDNPGDLPSLRSFAAAVDLASKLSFDINYYQTQNIYYELLKNGYPQLKLAAEKGDANAALWIEEFKDLGKKLSVRI